MPKKRRSEYVFLNLPFDPSYEQIFLAMIAGTTALGLTPRSVLELPTTKARLSRLTDIIHACRYSVHDLSRVQLSDIAPRCPRFNMPFELGLAVASAHYRRRTGPRHHWIVLEAVPHRLQVSLSDLNGFDPYIHRRTAIGTMEALVDAFTNTTRRVTLDQMVTIYGLLTLVAMQLKGRRQSSLFRPSPFRQLVLSANEIARELILSV